MIEVTASVDGLEVASSGVLQVCGNTIDAKVSGMDMKINFINGEPSNETKYFTSVEGRTLFLNLQNFTSPFPEGQFAPKEIGTVNGRSLLMAFSVMTLDVPTDSRIFNYTFYLGAQA
ncbi:hypothetical protein OP492_00860 [Pseudomonas mosselii]|uniref:DUF6864 domain-containing function n=1 Tax=Pseudomonas mosselii TaxID=78327 RepID=UPI002B05B1F1|nr:hypothetical protein [Pseudomonas mosselii]MEA3233204.1 hypothetical protein [Pseudomonas mosselii]